MLRRLEEKDAQHMLEWMHDERVNSKFRFNFASMTYDKVLAFIEKSFSEENVNFAFVNEQDEYMGTISLKHISREDMNAEYAIVTRTCAQGTGSASEATKEILKYAFEELNLHRVYLNVLVENERANAFYKKCGFRFEGTSKGHLLIQGEYKDLNWYAMTADEYFQSL